MLPPPPRIDQEEGVPAKVQSIFILWPHYEVEGAHRGV